MDRGELSRAEIHASGYQVDEAVRCSFEVDVDQQTIAAVEELLWGARPQVAARFDCDIKGHEGAGFLRYLRGGFYRAHRDVIPELVVDFAREIALVLFLTTARTPDEPGDCEGGALRLYVPATDASGVVALDVPQVAGTLAAFPATVLHEVLPVTAGVRDVVVDWFY